MITKQEHILSIVTEDTHTTYIHTVYCVTYILYAHTVVVYQYHFHKKNHTATLIV